MTLVRLLGAPRWEQGGGSTPLARDGSLWLMAYLSCQDGWVEREEVLELFYPGTEPGVARNRLRQLLHRTRGLEWAGGLESDPHGLRWLADCDVRRFRRAFTGGHWAEAVALYRGAFLEGSHTYELPAFEDWLESERENLQAVWRDAVLNHTARLEQAGAYTQAMPLLERALELDPYAEEALQAYLRSAALSGQRERAIKAYDDFRLRLERDLGLEPEPGTKKLLDSLLEAMPLTIPAQEAKPTRRGQAALTSFLGREAELEAIHAQLASPDCRLLTLTGPGGMGKTRLALEVSGLLRPGFAGEVYFVPLEAATSAAAMASGIAAELGLSLSGANDPTQGLLEFLRERRCLLVLDNFEQLLTPDAREGALHLVLEMLEQAGRVKLLVTSRHRLELQAEWVVPLEGLSIPTSGTLEAARRSSSARLFVERASRAKPGFALSAVNAPAIVRICRLSEGLPLGIELAAAWAGTLSPEEIAAELEDQLDLESGPALDRPQRHQTLRSAFQHSWQLLGQEEREALARLSVFRGGFERSASAQVSKASLRSLLSLVNKSLLRRSLEGRFGMLEVIRQYAALELHRNPVLEAQVQQLHAEYYLALAEGSQAKLHGPEQVKWLELFSAEHDNFRAALVWATENAQADLALRLASALHWFWYVRGHHREGRAWLEAALRLPGIKPKSAIRAEALRALGWLARELGDYTASQTTLTEALGLWQVLGNRAKEAETLYALGINHRETGDLDQAQALLLQAALLQRELGEQWGLSTTLNDLGIIQILRGDETAARGYFQESLHLKEAIGDPMGVAYALANLGLASGEAGYRTLTERSLAIKRELGDRQGMANSLYNLAEISFEQGDLGDARSKLAEALELFWQLGRRRAIATALAGLAGLNAKEGHPQACLRLAGAVEALVESSGFQLQGVNPQDFQRYLEQARAGVGDEAAKLYAEGRAMPLEDAVAYALRPPVSPTNAS